MFLWLPHFFYFYVVLHQKNFCLFFSEFCARTYVFIGLLDEIKGEERELRGGASTFGQLPPGCVIGPNMPFSSNRLREACTG